MDVFVARQPIFDARLKVYGYEFLYRSGAENSYTSRDGDAASLAVIRNVLLVVGAQRISGGKRVFVNFTKNLLLNGAASYLPKEIGVVEILETVEPDDYLLSALGALRSQGYCLALDDFILQGQENNPLIKLADIIKVDFRQTGEREQADIARRFPAKGRIKLVAEKTETREEFEKAAEMGYTYFQGYFFCRPVIIARRDISGYKVSCLRILKELSKESPSFSAIRKFIEQDPSLAYKLLKYINSAFFSLRTEVSSVKQALGLLGEEEIRKWASLAIVMEMGKDKPEEILKLSLLRAGFCERLAGVTGFEEKRSELFLMGLLSCLDVLLGRPMEEVLEDVPIGETVKQALLGASTPYGSILDMVISYERADWSQISVMAESLGVARSDIVEIYSRSVEWVDKAFQ